MLDLMTHCGDFCRRHDLKPAFVYLIPVQIFGSDRLVNGDDPHQYEVQGEEILGVR